MQTGNKNVSGRGFADKQNQTEWERFAREYVGGEESGPKSEADHPKSGPHRARRAPQPSQLILPGREVTVNHCAREAFTVLAPTHRYFIREKVVFEFDWKSKKLSVLHPDEFCSQLENYFTLLAWRTLSSGKRVLANTPCPAEVANRILKSDPARVLLPPINLVTAAPVFVERNGGIEILRKGYHSESGGIMVTHDYQIAEVSLNEAIKALVAIVDQFRFVAPSDKSRALATLIAPALRLGELLPFDFPLCVNEADQKQTGKTYHLKCTCALYNETPFSITQENKHYSVGSFEEKLSTGLVEGNPFIIGENIRGLLDCQMFESAIRGTGRVACRIAYRATILVPTNRFIWLLSSNKAEVTDDLAARSLLTRFLKHQPGHQFTKFGSDGHDLLEEIKRNVSFYLSCVLAIVRHWYAQGEPRTNDTRHDFRESCQSLDWIMQKIFGQAPLLDDHAEEQARISNPVRNWIRSVALAVEKSGRLGESLRASEIAGICADKDLPILHLRADADDDARNKMIGKLFKEAFHGVDFELELSGFAITRRTVPEYDRTQRKDVSVIRHLFANLRSVAPFAVFAVRA